MSINGDYSLNNGYYTSKTSTNTGKRKREKGTKGEKPLEFDEATLQKIFTKIEALKLEENGHPKLQLPENTQITAQPLKNLLNTQESDGVISSENILSYLEEHPDATSAQSVQQQRFNNSTTIALLPDISHQSSSHANQPPLEETFSLNLNWEEAQEPRELESHERLTNRITTTGQHALRVGPIADSDEEIILFLRD